MEAIFAKVLVFAPGGHGKTWFLGSAQQDPRTAPMLFLDFEGGLATLAGLDLDIVQIRSWEDYNEVFEALANGEHWKLPGSSLKAGETYKSVGIDSISETHIFALMAILDKNSDRRANPDLIEMGDYGIASTQMRRFLREFRDLPLHVFFTAGAKEVDQPRVGKVKVPALSGQMAEEAVHLMDVVGYLGTFEDEEEVEGEATMVKHRILIFDDPKMRVKARMPWGAVPVTELEDPTVTTLLDALGLPMPAENGSKKK
jgi:hypothetical protein